MSNRNRSSVRVAAMAGATLLAMTRLLPRFAARSRVPYSRVSASGGTVSAMPSQTLCTACTTRR